MERDVFCGCWNLGRVELPDGVQLTVAGCHLGGRERTTFRTSARAGPATTADNHVQVARAAKDEHPALVARENQDFGKRDESW